MVIEQVAPRKQITGAVATVEELVPDDDRSAEVAMRVVLAERYRTVRPFLALLAESVSLTAASARATVLAAVKTLPDLAARMGRLNPFQQSLEDIRRRLVTLADEALDRA